MLSLRLVFFVMGFVDLREAIMDSFSESKICLKACVVKVIETSLEGSPQFP